MANAIFVGTYGKVRLVTPLQNYTKAQIVAELMDDVNYEVVNLTWSCYEGGDAHCGECPTCVARIQAFKDNDYADPVDYLIDIDWRT